MDSGLAHEKSALRRAMRDVRKELPAADGARLSSEACRRLAALPEFAAARVVAAFRPKGGEIDPTEAMDLARRAGAKIVLPRVSSSRPPRLRFHEIHTESDLRPGSYGLMEPDPSCPEVGVEDIDLMLCPGLAFDRGCRRLGQGGGYYDEAGSRLRAVQRGTLVGFGFHFQIVERCPSAAHDVTLDCVVTDAHVFRCDTQNTKAAP